VSDQVSHNVNNLPNNKYVETNARK
jgi:hypothetical protein